MPVCLSVTSMSPAIGAELIVIQIVLWTRVGPRNHVLGGVQISLRKGQFGEGWCQNFPACHWAPFLVALISGFPRVLSTIVLIGQLHMQLSISKVYAPLGLGPPKGPKNAVVVPGDLDLQTHPSEGPNTSSVWIWRNRYFIHKQKNTDWRRQKQNLPQFTACDNKSPRNKNRLLCVVDQKRGHHVWLLTSSKHLNQFAWFLAH